MAGSKDAQENNLIVVTVSDDEMSAFLSLCPPVDGNEYTIRELTDALSRNKVSDGIRMDALAEMIRLKTYYTDVLAAQGTLPVDGREGYFEFLFSTDQDTKPKILPDGSVDYSSLGDVVVVEQGEVIARYIPATRGINGVNVRGRQLLAKNGREMVPLRGKGFVLSEDKKTYVAAVTGKVEWDGKNTLTVTDLFVIDGDVNHVTGNIKFAGDVHIRGNVVSGTMVNAFGHITVDGHVEAAHLIAGKDVILKNGIQGGGKGVIEAGGNVSGKFFEQTTVRARGYVNANAIMNCDIRSEESIIVSGRLGIIVGGSTTALRVIEATMIGNMAEVKTKVLAGAEKDLYAEIMKIEDQIKENSIEIEKIGIGIAKIDEFLKKNVRKDIQDKKMQLLRAKISKDSEVSDLVTQKET